MIDHDLDKPPWQPPGAAFGPTWTTLRGLMALASAHTLDRLDEPDERRGFVTAFGANLVSTPAGTGCSSRPVAHDGPWSRSSCWRPPPWT